MNGFLTFLSNNYLYFLIAAGVLFFALMGFLVDLKKEGDSTPINDTPETPIPDIPLIEESQTQNEVNTDTDILNEPNPTFNPAPAMPEEPIDIMANNSPVGVIDETVNPDETLNLNSVINDNSVPAPETLQPEQQFNQEQKIEEFK